jgi:hypothetical protein
MHANAVVKSPNQPLQGLLFLACNFFFFFSQPVGLVELAAEQRFYAVVRWSVAEPSVKRLYASVASD